MEKCLTSEKSLKTEYTTPSEDSTNCWKTELISVLLQITQAKLKGLAAQRDEMEIVQGQLSSCLDFVRKSFETECQGDILTTKRNIMK